MKSTVVEKGAGRQSKEIRIRSKAKWRDACFFSQVGAGQLGMSPRRQASE